MLIAITSTYITTTQFTCMTQHSFAFKNLITNTTNSETHSDEVVVIIIIIVTSCTRVNNPQLETGKKKKDI